MFDDWMEKFEEGLDRAAAVLWKLFEKDLEMTDALLERTELILAGVEAKMPASLRRFLRPPSDF
jgi:hypothetical protein